MTIFFARNLRAFLEWTRRVDHRLSLRCFVVGHDWWVDVDPRSRDDAFCCSRCRQRRIY